MPKLMQDQPVGHLLEQLSSPPIGQPWPPTGRRSVEVAGREPAGLVRDGRFQTPRRNAVLERPGQQPSDAVCST
jgi:hypothetical protein